MALSNSRIARLLPQNGSSHSQEAVAPEASIRGGGEGEERDGEGRFREDQGAGGERRVNLKGTRMHQISPLFHMFPCPFL